MRAELQDVMNMLRRLQGSIDSGSATEELGAEVDDIMDALFEAMKKLPEETVASEEGG